MATIGDVARKAGVSRTAVSFAFNDPTRLSTETLQRILQVAEELGYYPNPLARSLISKRVGVLGVLIPQGIEVLFSNPFFTELLRGIGDVCDAYEFSLLLVPPIQGSLTHALSRAAVDGYLVLGLDEQHEALDLLRRSKVPFVTLDGPALPDHPAVNVDDREGARLAAEHLVALGHRRLVIISVAPAEGGRTAEDIPAYSGVAARRLSGYLAAAATAPVPVHMQTVMATASTREAGEQALRAIWSAGARPTAILAMSDSLAIGVLDAAGALGLRVPDDLSVVGFDDTPEASMCHPPLTTVAQPTLEKGRQAARLLIEQYAGTGHIEHHRLPVSLVVRDTTAEAPQQ